MGSLAFLSTNELLIVAIVGIVLFGGAQLPKLARTWVAPRRNYRRASQREVSKLRPRGLSPKTRPRIPTSESDTDSESEKDSNSSS
jgi:Sec-independent protein translocase protein TatA